MPETVSPHLGPALLADATRAVDELVEQLEPVLDHEHCRLLYRLRLACESLGMIRAAAQTLSVLPDPRRLPTHTR